MKLKSFSVKNYRSITDAKKINLDNLTILVGKNNEGKSNIIQAISIGMNAIKDYNYLTKRNMSSFNSSFRRIINYQWERDFPVKLQNKKRISKSSQFELEFELDTEELKEFNKQTKSRLSTNNFSIIVEINEHNKIKFNVSKKGTKSLNKKVDIVTAFVADKITFNYIPAIRTEIQAFEMIRETLSEELKILEKEPKYLEALKVLNDLQKEPLDKIALKVNNTLKDFITTIEDVKIDIQESTRRLSLRTNIDVKIDDGVLTNIEYKGDGVKSLVTLAMLTDRFNVDQSSIIAIDEPEAHLHPGAINQLNKVLKKLISDNQVIISTHNPLFVNKSNIKSNIIISSGKAKSAKNIKEIRDCLGVKISDNLISSNNILYVEGESDKIYLNSILINKSVKIRKSIENSELSIIPLGGASKLSSELYSSRNNIMGYHVLLDNDDAGIKAFDKAVDEQLIDLKQVTLTKFIGMHESEFEDCILLSSYKDEVKNEYGVIFNEAEFNKMKKWSIKVKNAFDSCGKPWNDNIEKKLKVFIANTVSDKISEGHIVINEHRKNCVENIISSLEEIIN